MAALKYSRQREAIIDFLQTRKDHPSADMVYMNVRKEFPNISLGTVYRNLTLLSDLGVILRLHLEDGVDHFDATTAPHFHFYCTRCKSVLDLDLEDSPSLVTSAQEQFAGKIQGHATYFYGLCDQCIHK